MTAPVRVKRPRLADSMPSIAAWVADLRQAFGDDLMDDVILRGRHGEAVFFAAENGHSVGTKSTDPENVWNGEGLANRHFCTGCDGACVGTGKRCSTVAGGSAR
jgi:hydroxyethylthiazole kinase-like sugar kinase family protein